jgi:hypothetical protein
MALALALRAKSLALALLHAALALMLLALLTSLGHAVTFIKSMQKERKH